MTAADRRAQRALARYIDSRGTRADRARLEAALAKYLRQGVAS